MLKESAQETFGQEMLWSTCNICPHFYNIEEHCPLVAALMNCYTVVKVMSHDQFWFSLEPNAWEHEAFWLHLQQQMVHRNLHHPLPQQEGSFWGEDYPQPSYHLLPRVRRYTAEHQEWYCIWDHSDHSLQKVQLDNKLLPCLLNHILQAPTSLMRLPAISRPSLRTWTRKRTPRRSTPTSPVPLTPRTCSLSSMLSLTLLLRTT